MDPKFIETQLLAAQSELQQLKSTLTPCIIFLNDILEIRKKRNIPESTSYSLLSLISLDIKSEIMKEVRPVYATMNQIEVLQDQMQDVKQESLTVKELILKTEETFKTQQILTSRLEHDIRSNHDKIEDVRFQLDGKASISNALELRQLIKNCATISQLEIAKNRINDCAGKYQLEEMQKNVILVENRLKKFTKKKEVKKMIEDLKDELVVNTEKEFMSIHMFEQEKEAILSKIGQTESSFNELAVRFEKTDSVITKKFSMLKKQLDSAPWMTSITEINNCLVDKSSYEDLQKFRQEINKTLFKNSDLIGGFQRSIATFEEVIARFDEILLLKAGKDEVYRIDQKLAGVVDKGEFSGVIEPIQGSLEKVQDAIKKLVKSTDIMDRHIEVISGKCNTLIKENIDVSLVAKNLSDLRSVVDRKSNREDIYEIYDLMAKKIEITHLSESTHLAKKQLELCAVLLLSLCRTLVKNGENPLVIKKNREELLASLNTLVNWISGEQSGAKLLLHSRQEGFEEKSKRSLSRSLPRRNSSVYNESKFTVDFPKIKMT